MIGKELRACSNPGFFDCTNTSRSDTYWHEMQTFFKKDLGLSIIFTLLHFYALYREWACNALEGFKVAIYAF